MWRAAGAAKENGVRGYADNIAKQHKEELPPSGAHQQVVQKAPQINQNISNALQSQKNLEESKESPSQYPEVHTFLETVTLNKYNQRFVDNGIEDLETILELNDGHLDSM